MSESIVIEEPIPSIVVLEEPPKLITVIEEQQKDVIVISGNVIDTTLLSKEAKQDIANISLASIDNKLTAITIDDTLLAKESKQDDTNVLLFNIDSKLTSPLNIIGTVSVDNIDNPLTVSGTVEVSNLPAILDVSVLNFPPTQDVNVLNFPVTNNVTVDNFPSIQQVSANVLPLPLGASTSALQTTANNSLSSIDTKLTNNATSTLQSAGNASLSNLDSNMGAKSDLLASSDTGNFSLIALFKRLLDKLTSVISVRITDGAGTVNTKSLGTALLSGDISIVVSSVIHGLTTGGGGGYVDVKVTPSGSLTTESNIVSSVLPAGASTSALQTSGNLSLTSIDSKVPTNGQKTSALSIPVVIANEQTQDTMVIGQAGQATLGNNVLLATAGAGSIDTTINSNSSYHSFYTQIIASAGISAGQIIFEGSNDAVTYHPMTWFDDTLTNGVVTNVAIAIAANANRFFSGKISYRYMRCRISTGFVGGTIQAITRFSSSIYRPRINTIAPVSGASFSTTLSSSLPTGTGVIGAVNLGVSTSTDVASGAIITSTTTSAFTQGNFNLQEYIINVTAISGTNPTLDVTIQISKDAGTNWISIYDFPRITAIGSYSSPVINNEGNRIRYIQTVGGTTPSFTRSIIRNNSNGNGHDIRQRFDRSIVITTLNSTTIPLYCDGSKYLMFLFSTGANAISTPAVLSLEGSEDNLNWYSLSVSITGVNPNTTYMAVANDVFCKFARAIVSTAGVGGNLNYILIKGIN